jgi:hypothetical protein
MGTYRGETITPKKVMTLARLTNALTKMSQQVPYKNVVKCNDEEREEFLKLKNSLEDKEQVILKQSALNYIQKMQELEPYFKDCPKTDIYETYVNKIIVNMIKYNLQTGNEAY